MSSATPKKMPLFFELHNEVRRLRGELKALKWLDKYMCEWLLRPEGQISVDTATSACNYRSREDGTTNRLAQLDIPVMARGHIKCLVTTPAHYRKLRRTKMTSYLCYMPVSNTSALIPLVFSVTSEVEHFKTQWDTVASSWNVGKLEDFEYDLEGKSRLSDYDCVIVDFDYASEEDNYSDMNPMVDVLTSNQVFVATGTLKQRDSVTCNMDCMLDIFWKLGGFESCPLAYLSSTWRIWCNKEQNNSAINYPEIVTWAALEILRKRKEALESQT